MKNNICILIGYFLILSCEKESELSMQPIEGIWKLIRYEKITDETSTHTIDYYENEIIYNFSTDGILNVNRSFLGAFEAGNYNFEYIPNIEPLKSIVKINSMEFDYSFQNDTIKLDQSYVDGATLYLKKQSSNFNNNPIIGEWVLIKVTQLDWFDNTIMECSTEEFLYNFLSQSSISVIGNNPEHSNGLYNCEYTYINNGANPWQFGMQQAIKIDSKIWLFNLINNELKLTHKNQSEVNLFFNKN